MFASSQNYVGGQLGGLAGADAKCQQLAVAAGLKGTFKARPQRSELPSTINESLVVELYSK